MTKWLLCLMMLRMASPLVAQKDQKKKEPKIDSLIVTVHLPRQEALDATVSAFQANRLQVTNTTSSMIEADLGKKAGFAAVFERKVRALFLSSVSSETRIMLVGNETRYSQGSNPSEYRIDSKAKSEGGMVWHQIVAVAKQLESAPSAPVDAASRSPESAASAPTTPSVSPTAPPTDTSESSRRTLIEDMRHLGLVQVVFERTPGVVRVATGEAFYNLDQRSRDANFRRLYDAYGGPQRPVYLELWDKGQKFGEYSGYAFNIGPRFSEPR